MSCSRKARGLAAISVVALAAGLFISSVGVSPLFADEASTNGCDVNRVIDSDATNGGDGGSAPDGLSALSNEGNLKTRRRLLPNRLIRHLKMLGALRT